MAPVRGLQLLEGNEVTGRVFEGEGQTRGVNRVATVNVVLAYILVVAIVGFVLAAILLRLHEMGKSKRHELGVLIGVFAVLALIGVLSLLLGLGGELIVLLLFVGFIFWEIEKGRL